MSRRRRHRRQADADDLEAGESVTITVNGRPIATLEPVRARRRWVRRDEFVRRLAQADPGLEAELTELAPGTTDELPL
jgi:antitoxin (DNA-binding transcriptional repressor) of toxin-antitoxin stability system